MGRQMNPVERFWLSVNKTDGCWEWTGIIARNGYGSFTLKSRSIPAHRFAYELTYGAIPEGLLACHKCDNRRCVRPDHLFVGTQKDNMRDCARKGRLPWQKFAGLDVQQVLEAVRLVNSGLTLVETGQILGVGSHTIGRIIRGKAWEDVTGIVYTPPKQPRQKLTGEKVMQIVELVRSGLTHKKTAERFGVGETTVRKIMIGEIWSHVTGFPYKARTRRS